MVMNPIELMGEIERTSNESGDAKPGTVVMLYSQFQALLWAIEAQTAELAQARARIGRLAHHLRQAHTFIESTEAFGNAASDGILQAGNDKATAWNVDESKAALNESEPQSAAALKAEAINIVFDGPPHHKSGRFIEVETDDGKGIRCGEWIERPDGLWALRITELLEREAKDHE